MPTLGGRLLPGRELADVLAAAGACKADKWGYAKLDNVLLV